MNLTTTEVEAFIARSFEMMREKARQTGDRVADRPDLERANSIYALITHCIAVCDFWIGHVVAGDPTERDRDSEFEATGSLSEIEAEIDSFLERLPGLVERASVVDPLPDHEVSIFYDWPWTTPAVLLEVVEEMYQHLGHIDLTADLLTAEPGASRA